MQVVRSLRRACAAQRRSKMRRQRLGVLAFCVMSVVSARAQIAPGHGAMSAQDVAKWHAAQAKAAAGASGMGTDRQGMDMRSMASTADPADGVCARFASGATVSAPPELRSQNGTLEVTLNFFTTTDEKGLVRYCYVTADGQEAPTLRVNPGDTLLIHFHNELPASAAAAMAQDSSMAGMKMTLSDHHATTSASSACEGAMSATATNIHFHGLNAAPVCGQDEVVHTLVAAGQTFDYSVQIPSNEPPGLYWYHPHPHGFSEGQVLGGATGAIIVEGLQSVVPSLAGLPERTFVLRDQLLPASTATGTNAPAWDLSINHVPVTFPGYAPAVIATNPNRQELWRVANTGADTILNLQYTIAGAAQTMQLVAVDGVPLAAGTSGQTSVNETNLVLPPGSRAEFVVTTPNVGDTAQLVTEYWSTGPDGDYDPARPIANIVSSVGAEPMATPAQAVAALKASSSSTASPAKVTRFAALSTTTPVAQRNLYFSEVLLDPTNPLSPTTFFITEEGHTPEAFTMGQAPNIVVHDETVEDWVIENRAQEDHIFHIHQIHFQVLEVNGVAVNDPAIRDTVDLPFWSGTGPYPSVKVRMDFRDPNIVGTFMYHCHILEHEDGGMMGEIQVLPAGSAASATVASSAASLTPNGVVTLTASVATASSGGAVPTGSVQFQMNGDSVGNPVALTDGVASLTATVNGNAGVNSITALYEGDGTYTEALSPAVSVTLPAFSLSTMGGSGAVGAGISAPVTVNLANSFSGPVSFACTLPSGMTESACFVNPGAATTTGPVTLTVNTTPSHPLSSAAKPEPFGYRRGLDFGAASGAVSLASLLLLVLPRGWRRRGTVLSLLLVAAGSVLLGCSGASGSGSSEEKVSAGTDPGTPPGTYAVMVTGTAGSGASLYSTTVTVPITLH